MKPQPRADLEHQLEKCRRELAEAWAYLDEALEQQTATAEVLRVISSSPGELEPVFRAMLENAVRICDAKFGTLFRYDGEILHLAARTGTPPALAEFQRRRGPFRPEAGSLHDRVLQTKQVAHSTDYAAEPNPGNAAKLGGARSTVVVPMLKDDQLIGTIVTYRQEVRPFTEKHSISSRTSRARPLSLSRTRGSLTSCVNRWSSKQRPRRYCASLAARPASWSRSSRRCCRSLG